MHFLLADLEQNVTRLGMRTVLWASLILISCTAIALLVKKKPGWLKVGLFSVMAVTLVTSTLLLFGSTVYLNTRAESKGPVHWHSDIEFWACGAELELRDPHGLLSNKIGSATYHEHNDKRIHLEGVVVHKDEDAGLEKFMRVTGGYLGRDRIGIPLNEEQANWFASAENDKLDGDKQYPENFSLATGAGEWITEDQDGPVIELKNGNYCTGPHEQEAEVQVFVYKFDEASKTYSQRKLSSPLDYVMRDESVVPPGDCVIVEFDQPKDRTDKLCQQYGVRDITRCLEFGVKEFDSELCNIQEVTR